MNEKIEAARAAVQALEYSPAWAAAEAMRAVLDAVQAVADAQAVEPAPADPVEGA